MLGVWLSSVSGAVWAIGAASILLAVCFAAVAFEDAPRIPAGYAAVSAYLFACGVFLIIRHGL